MSAIQDRWIAGFGVEPPPLRRSFAEGDGGCGRNAARLRQRAGTVNKRGRARAARPRFAGLPSRLSELRYCCGMAMTTIRRTYALDPQTVRTLEEVARGWGVSKSEALRRAIRTAASRSLASRRSPSDTLDELQESVGLNAASARAWVRRVRQERQATRRGRGK
jgi:hypothetical protein